MKQLKITTQFWKEDALFIAYSPELDMVAQGYTLEEANKNLNEVIEIQFEEMNDLGTLNEYLQERGFRSMAPDNILKSNREIISFNKEIIPIDYL
jgi:predicted RNase H-like HicB family nuclease